MSKRTRSNETNINLPKTNRTMKTNQTKGAVCNALTSRLSIRFGALAMSYYPDRPYQMAVRLFRIEIETTPRLMTALEKVGYAPHQRLLSPRQVKVIAAYLGEPR